MNIDIKPPTDRPEVTAKGMSRVAPFDLWEITRYADGSMYLQINNTKATFSVADAENLIQALSTTLKGTN